MDDMRKLFRIACEVRKHLNEFRENIYRERVQRFSNLRTELQGLADEITRHEKAISHGWYLASKRVKNRIIRAIDELSSAAWKSREISQDVVNVPELSTLVEDLIQLERDCGPMDYDRDKRTVSIVTDPIEFEGIFLGEFKIELYLEKLAGLCGDGHYYCVALDPNPAASSEDTTHPHVSNDQLCEGEGSATISAALQQGRLCDFFMMVTSILNTYNAGGAYVSLSDWEGMPCYDCGYVMSSEDVYYCNICNEHYCDQCCAYCRFCDESICVGCAAGCGVCEETACPDCMHECRDCGKLCCQDCIDEQICNNCEQESEDDHEEEIQVAAAEGSGKKSETQKPAVGSTCPDIYWCTRRHAYASFQPHRMGKAAVFQRQIRK